MPVATSRTRENPAFEKAKHKQLLGWKAERVKAAKLFKESAGKELPLDDLLREARDLREIAISAPGDPESAVIEQRTGLNAREAKALRLFVAGRSNQEIADGIGISLVEAVALVGRIMTRIKVESRAEATAFAFKNGLV